MIGRCLDHLNMVKKEKKVVERVESYREVIRSLKERRAVSHESLKDVR